MKGPEWPVYQGGPGFAGVSSDASVKPPFKLAWSYRMDGDATGDAGGVCHSPPATVSGLLVVGCGNGHVYASREKPRNH